MTDTQAGAPRCDDRVQRLSGHSSAKSLERIFDALLAGEQGAAGIAVRGAIDTQCSASEIDAEIIAPARCLIEQRWQRGELPRRSRLPSMKPTPSSRGPLATERVCPCSPRESSASMGWNVLSEPPSVSALTLAAENRGDDR